MNVPFNVPPSNNFFEIISRLCIVNVILAHFWLRQVVNLERFLFNLRFLILFRFATLFTVKALLAASFGFRAFRFRRRGTQIFVSDIIRY